MVPLNKLYESCLLPLSKSIKWIMINLVFTIIPELFGKSQGCDSKLTWLTFLLQGKDETQFEPGDECSA